jgi:hypothetical protein
MCEMHEESKFSDWSAFGIQESKEHGNSNSAFRRASEEVKGTETQCQGSKSAKMGTTQ